MANTPEGTPYVESSDLVANYPASSLELANRVDLVGVLPFASATARNTAIPSPTDGQQVYLQDTNTNQFYNGTSWLTLGGLTSCPPTSIANSGGSASTTGNITTFTTVTSISLNGVFNSNFRNYRILVNYGGALNVRTRFRWRLSGSDISTTNYNYTSLGQDTAAASFNEVGVGQTSGQLTFSSPNSFGASAIIDVFDPFTAGNRTTAYANSTGRNSTDVISFQTGLQLFNINGAVDGITLFVATSTLTGVISVYGYNN